jgi:hypothetical protein
MNVPTVKELLDAIGLQGANLVAGFIGGTLNVLIFKRINPWDASAALVAGTFTAGYLGESVASITHAPVGATCFLVGFGGVVILGGSFAALRQRLFANGTKGASNA